jgi:hypothetical protein
MIQAAASSLPSSLALGTGAQPAAGDDAANSGAFAAALTASMVPEEDGASEAKAATGLAIGPVTTRKSGNTAGNILPDQTDLAASPKPAADAPATKATAPAAPVVSEIILPGLVVPVTAQLAQPTKSAVARPATEPSTAENLAKNVAAQLVRAPRSVIAERIPALPHGKTGTKTEEIAAAPDDVTPPATLAAAATDPVSLIIPIAIAVAAQPAETKPATSAAPHPKPAQAAPAPTTSTPTAPASAADPTNPAKAPVRIDANTIEAAPIPASTVQAAMAQSATPSPSAAAAAQVVVSFALPQTPVEQTAAAVQPTVQQLAAHQPAALRPKAMPRTLANTQSEAVAIRGDTAAVPATTLAAETAEQPTKTAAHGASAPAKSDVAADAPVAAVPTEPQVMPVVANAPSSAQTVAPVAAAPTTGVAQLSSHDFTALVDRLVEAREAASPQAVHAAVSHREFGQVSLRFDQDANGLSVSMSSGDPEFARAVQASAASAGSQAAGDNGAAPRQDTQGHQQQPAAGSSSGQPQSQTQSQAQSQAYGRDDRSPQPRPELRSAARQKSETDRSDANGDIFA